MKRNVVDHQRKKICTYKFSGSYLPSNEAKNKYTVVVAVKRGKGFVMSLLYL